MCYNNELMQVDRVIIDTSAIMHENFQIFVGKVKADLSDVNKKMTVPRVVCLELAKHLDAKGQEKSEASIRGHSVLTDNQQIFDIENKDLRDEEVTEAFADPEIIADLARNRIHCSQMLITGDKDLGIDALKLNSLLSCKGKKIVVCYIGKYGDLMFCKDVESIKQPIQESHNEQKQTEKAPIQDTIHKSNDKNDKLKKWKIDWKSALIGAFVTGLAALGVQQGLPAMQKVAVSLKHQQG